MHTVRAVAGLVTVVIAVGLCQAGEQLTVGPVRDQLANELAGLPSPPQSVPIQQSTVARFGEAAVRVVYKTDLVPAAVHEFYEATLPAEGLVQEQPPPLVDELLTCFVRGEERLSVETTTEAPHTFTIRLARWTSICP